MIGSKRVGCANDGDKRALREEGLDTLTSMNSLAFMLKSRSCNEEAISLVKL